MRKKNDSMHYHTQQTEFERPIWVKMTTLLLMYNLDYQFLLMGSFGK